MCLKEFLEAAKGVRKEDRSYSADFLVEISRFGFIGKVVGADLDILSPLPSVFDKYDNCLFFFIKNFIKVIGFCI